MTRARLPTDGRPSGTLTDKVRTPIAPPISMMDLLRACPGLSRYVILGRDQFKSIPDIGIPMSEQDQPVSEARGPA